jgi:hypothetical protein
MKALQFAMMKPEHEKTSRYRGVTVKPNQHNCRFHVRVNIKKVFVGLGKRKGPVSVGCYPDERQAALAYDQVCRKYGVPEKELNFPRDRELREVRLFDDECYFCCQKRPTDPVATPCNHVFCRSCVNKWLGRAKQCPCCQTPVPSESALRSVDLVSHPEQAAIKSAPNEENKLHGQYPDGEEIRYATETGPTVGDMNESQEAIKEPEERNVTNIVNIKRNAGNTLKVDATARKKRRTRRLMNNWLVRGLRWRLLSIETQKKLERFRTVEMVALILNLVWNRSFRDFLWDPDSVNSFQVMVSFRVLLHPLMESTTGFTILTAVTQKI